jgi:uncharacterized membrane protein YdbT with pleckstrin-like domain
MGFPKRLLGDGETLVLALRPHAKRLVGPAVLLLVVAPLATWVGAVVPAGSMQAPARWAIAAVALLVVLRWSVWPFLVWWNTLYVVTDRRLVMRSGVINRHGHDMPLSRLNDVTFSHNLLDRMLGCGDLVVESAGERGQVVLDDIPRVEQVQRTLYRLSDATRGGYDAGDDAGEDAGGSGDGADLDQDGGGRRRRPWGRSR